MVKTVYTADCVGTLGELYQGPLFTKQATEISIISALSRNNTQAKLTFGKSCNLEELGKIKVKKALSNFLERISSRKIEGSWSFESDIIIGAGMSSSTADIISGLRCACKVLGVIPTLDDIISSIYGVERSDSVFIDIPCMYLSQQQKIIDLYKPIEKIYCIYGLENKRIDTSKL